MIKSQKFLVFVLLSGPAVLTAQDNVAAGKALNIPFPKYGLSIGNSREFNGLRLNFADRDTRLVNGVNITIWAHKFSSWFNPNQFYTTEVNGVSFGIVPTGGMMRGLNAGILRVASSKNLSGISVSGLNIFANGSINGIAMSGFLTQGSMISGFAFSGIAVGGTGGISGIAIGGLAVSSDRSDINGAAASIGVVFCGGEITGIGISGLYLKASSLKGVGISGYTNTNQTSGLTIALFNYTRKLNGVQIGILNYAGNNRKLVRLMPLVNIHLKNN